MSRLQVIASVTSHREQLKQYMILIVHELSEKSVVSTPPQIADSIHISCSPVIATASHRGSPLAHNNLPVLSQARRCS